MRGGATAGMKVIVGGRIAMTDIGNLHAATAPYRTVARRWPEHEH
jgi:hypothetical protein